MRVEQYRFNKVSNYARPKQLKELGFSDSEIRQILNG